MHASRQAVTPPPLHVHIQPDLGHLVAVMLGHGLRQRIRQPPRAPGQVVPTRASSCAVMITIGTLSPDPRNDDTNSSPLMSPKCREAVRPPRLSGLGMSRTMASGSRVVGADTLVDKLAHRGSECPTPAGRNAEERGRVIWVE